MQNDWAFAEMRNTHLWDRRCRATLISACQRLAEQPEVSFSRALGSQRKAVSRILHHPTTDAQGLLDGHTRATSLRCQAHDLVLVASDTTVCDLTTHPAVEGVGPISSHPYQRGFLIHSALALSPDGVPLGLLHQQSWVREPSLSGKEEPGLSEKERKSEKEESQGWKESRKWLDALRGVEAALPPLQKALLVQDREADVFSFFAAPRRSGLDLLIRATHPRRVQTGAQERDTQTAGTLLTVAASAPLVASVSVPVHARPDREARQARVSVRVCSLTVLAPHQSQAPAPPPVRLQVVCAREEDPPASVGDPIHWVLLTTLAVPDADTALRLVGYYALRWRIERFHYVLKSGCRIERLQMDTFATLQKAVSLYSVVAWRLLHLTYLARAAPETPAWEAVSDTEQHVLERATGQPITTVRLALHAVARIGGFVAIPSAPEPGVKSLWLGWRRLQDMVAGFQLAALPHAPT